MGGDPDHYDGIIGLLKLSRNGKLSDCLRLRIDRLRVEERSGQCSVTMLIRQLAELDGKLLFFKQSGSSHERQNMEDICTDYENILLRVLICRIRNNLKKRKKWRHYDCQRKDVSHQFNSLTISLTGIVPKRPLPEPV